MRNLWILPDRNQDGMSPTLENEHIHPISEIVKLQDFPPELVLGIPEEILRANSENLFIYGQFAKLATGGTAFCLSIPAGKDISGRKVFISNLQILASGEHPEVPPSPPANTPRQEREWVDQLVNGAPSLYAPIRSMLRATTINMHAKTFSSELLFTTRYKPDWMPKKKDAASNKAIIIAALIAVILIAATIIALKPL